jgi:hypothetical protein
MSYSMSRLRTLHKNSARLQVLATDTAYIDLVVKKTIRNFLSLTPGGNVIKLLFPQFANFYAKLEGLGTNTLGL